MPDLEKDTHPGMLRKPARASIRSKTVDFSPLYEMHVNDNLRKFGQLEGQVANQAFDFSGGSKPGKTRLTYRKLLIICLPIVLFLTFVISAGVVTAQTAHKQPKLATSSDNANHTRPTPTMAIPQTGASSPSSNSQSTVPTLAPANQDTILTAPTPPVTTITYHLQSASASKEPMQTATTGPMTTKLSAEVSHSSSTPTFVTRSTLTSVTTQMPKTTMTTAPAHMAESLRSKASSAAAHTVTGSIRFGFCGTPGTPCLGGRDMGELQESEMRYVSPPAPTAEAAPN